MAKVWPNSILVSSPFPPPGAAWWVMKYLLTLFLLNLPHIFMPHEELDPSDYKSLFEEMENEREIPEGSQREEEQEECYPYLEDEEFPCGT